MNTDLSTAQVIIGEPRLTYRFSESANMSKRKINAHAKLSKFRHFQAQSKLNHYQQALVRTQSNDSGDNNKWTYLSELANMCTDWEAIIAKIHEAVSRIHIVNEEDQSDVDEEEANEDNFDL